MEPQYQQTQNPQEDAGSKAVTGGGYMCSRQSSTRWTPTTDQIRILKDLYYNNGVRSPSAEQIQRISARLRQYGKIEGKNVFYWFQNHKARERQKKRFTTSDVPVVGHPHIMQQQQQQRSGFGINVHNANNSTTNVSAYDHINHNKFYPNVTASAGGTSGGGGSSNFGHSNFGSWADPYTSPYTILDKRPNSNSTLVFDDQENIIMEEDHLYQDNSYVQSAAANSPEIETLPLFPVHAEDIHGGFGSIKSSSDGFYSGWYCSDDGVGNGRTSLELSLNSYGHMTPGYFRSY